MSLARRRKLVLYANLSDAFAAVIYAWAIFSGGMFTIQPGGVQLAAGPIPAWVCWTLFALWPFDVALCFYRIGHRNGELA